MIFTDPDLTITVDLEREEQEKNGRRKLKIISFLTLEAIQLLQYITIYLKNAEKINV